MSQDPNDLIAKLNGVKQMLDPNKTYTVDGKPMPAADIVKLCDGLLGLMRCIRDSGTPQELIEKIGSAIEAFPS